MLQCTHAVTLSDLLSKLHLLADTNYRYIVVKVRKKEERAFVLPFFFLLCQQSQLNPNVNSDNFSKGYAGLRLPY